MYSKQSEFHNKKKTLYKHTIRFTPIPTRAQSKQKGDIIQAPRTSLYTCTLHCEIAFKQCEEHSSQCACVCNNISLDQFVRNSKSDAIVEFFMQTFLSDIS